MIELTYDEAVSLLERAVAEREGLVVLDPEDKRECAWLADASRDACAEDIGWLNADAVQRALRSIRDERAEEFEPKQPAEPTEIGTKVELKDGGVAYRMDDGEDQEPWYELPSGCWQDWSFLCEIGIVRVLTPTRQGREQQMTEKSITLTDDELGYLRRWIHDGASVSEFEGWLAARLAAHEAEVRAKAKGEIIAELVCCDAYDGSGDTKGHDICYWSKAAALIAGGDA